MFSYSLLVTSLLLLFHFLAFCSHSQTYTYNYNCVDADECEDETIITTSNIYCKGFRACFNSTLEADGSVFCTGDHGCRKATISGDSDVRCQSQFSCYESTISKVGYRMQVYGYDGVRSSTIYGDGTGSLMYVHSLTGARDSKTYKIPYILARGPWAFLDAEIYSTDLTNLTVILQGYYSGSSLDIYCYDGSTCEVECGNAPGCRNTYIYCYSGASCSYTCSSSCAYCPTIYNESSTTMTDYIKNEFSEQYGINTFSEWVDAYQQEKDSVHRIVMNNKIDEIQEKQIKMYGDSIADYGDKEYFEWRENYYLNNIYSKWFAKYHQEYRDDAEKEDNELDYQESPKFFAFEDPSFGHNVNNKQSAVTLESILNMNNLLFIIVGVVITVGIEKLLGRNKDKRVKSATYGATNADGVTSESAALL